MSSVLYCYDRRVKILTNVCRLTSYIGLPHQVETKSCVDESAVVNQCRFREQHHRVQYAGSAPRCTLPDMHGWGGCGVRGVRKLSFALRLLVKIVGILSAFWQPDAGVHHLPLGKDPVHVAVVHPEHRIEPRCLQLKRTTVRST